MLLLWFKGLDPAERLSHPLAELHCVCWEGGAGVGVGVCLTPELIYTCLFPLGLVFYFIAVYQYMLSHIILHESQVRKS